MIKGGWIRDKNWPLKVLAISSVVALQSSTAEQVAEADIVICSYRILFSLVYSQRRAELTHGDGARPAIHSPSNIPELYKLAQATSLFVGNEFTSMKQYASAYNRRKSGVVNSQVNDWHELRFPVLEMFY